MDQTKEPCKITDLIKDMQEAIKEKPLDEWEKGYNSCARFVLEHLGVIEINYN